MAKSKTGVSAKLRSLADIRAQIDGIDDALLALIMKRAEIVHEVRAAKAVQTQAPTSAMRPAREAQVLRRLAQQFDNSLPLGVIMRIWRELFSAKTALQGPLSVNVFGAGQPIAYWDLARFYFGALTPMQLCQNAAIVLRAVSREPGAIGVLPEPGSVGDLKDADADWWLQLLSGEETSVRIIARLPFLEDASKSGNPASFAIARLAFEPSGDDTTLLVVETSQDVSATGVSALLGKANLKGRRLASARQDGAPGARQLVAVEGYVSEKDITRLRDVSGGAIAFARIVGGYANAIRIEQALRRDVS